MSSRPPLANNSSNPSSLPNYNNNNNNASSSSPLLSNSHGSAGNLHRRHDSLGLLSGGDRDSAVDDRRSEISGAGYSAYSGHRASEEPNFHMRLVRFYQRYNPEKIPRVAEFLEAYRGEEEELFRTLSQKYGPEPEPSVISLGSRSEASRQQIGVATVPKIVSKEEGHCDRETPYYPSQRTIMESDLCALLATRKTTHADLAPTFIGYVTAHPNEAWNGLTYITNVPVPIDEESRFLGHLWAGSLSNTKTIVHEKVAYTRTVFHCGESCSNPQFFPHERWRLTLIRCDHMQDCLYRVLWDPVLSPAAAAELLKAAPNAVEQDRSFFSFFKRQNSEKLAPNKSGTGSVTGGVGPSSTAKPVSSGFSSRSQQQHHATTSVSQQQQPSYQPQPPQPPAYPPPMQLAPPTNLQPLPSSAAGAAIITSPTNNIHQPNVANLQQQPGGVANASPQNVHASSSNNLQNGHHHHHHNSAPISAVAGGVAGNASNINRSPAQFHQQQPQQPQMVNSFETLINLVQGLEGRLTERLSDLDRRLQAVEGDIVFLKEVSEQRQIEQLPEPWLDDGGTSHQGSSAAPGMQQSRAHKKMKKEQTQKEKAQAMQRMRRRQHRKRLESDRNRLDDDGNVIGGGGGGGGGGDQHGDGTETVYTTSVGTSIATSGYHHRN